jgi:cytochrome P450
MQPSAMRSIPGDAGLPLLGSSLKWLTGPTEFLRHRYDKYGEISWTNLFGVRMVSMLGPDCAQFVLLNRDNVFSNEHAWSYFIGPFFHRGVMLLDGDEHRHHRRIMQAAFTTQALRGYLQTMNPAIEQGIAQWHPGAGFEIFTALKQLTLDIATQVFMGYRLGDEASKLNKAFIDTVRAGTGLIRRDIPLTRWHKGVAGRRVLEDFFRSQLAHKRRSTDDDMFSQLCRATTEEGDRFSDDDIVNHMIFLMMAAHDTTTITLTSIFYQLARHPQWQQKLRQENIALGSRHMAAEHIEQLRGMTLVMKEALRLLPPVPSLPRRVMRDVSYKEFLVPRGSYVSISPSFTHFMPQYWRSPLQFDPLRFSAERREDKVHPFAWMPFGGGAHKCIGLHFAEMQVKAILHQVLQRFEWKVPAAYEMRLDNTALPVPADKLPVALSLLA